MPVGTGYFPGGNAAAAGASPGIGDSTTDEQYWTLSRMKRAYLDYLNSKREEIEEQQDSRRYRHGVHWTAEQIKILRARRQPLVTFNRVGRKIDGVVGLVEKLRQDPKAYPRTPQHEQGAELRHRRVALLPRPAGVEGEVADRGRGWRGGRPGRHRARAD